MLAEALEANLPAAREKKQKEKERECGGFNPEFIFHSKWLSGLSGVFTATAQDNFRPKGKNIEGSLFESVGRPSTQQREPNFALPIEKGKSDADCSVVANDWI
ncbi:MAG: hypothetical protein IPO63_01705 [Bacteroidetes bacterium]|nr:hypothetical protein [Bacteroidota bacterium]